VKDLIEAVGVPHPEIDLILANGESVDFGYQVQDGDRISVYRNDSPDEQLAHLSQVERRILLTWVAACSSATR
jgi:uncharacterized protein